MSLNSIIPEMLMPVFCVEHNVDGVDIYNGQLVGYNYECVETYYGHSLIEPFITEWFPLDYVLKWVENTEEVYILVRLESQKDLPEIYEIIEDDEEDDLYEEWLAEELNWYNHARMMGWE